MSNGYKELYNKFNIYCYITKDRITYNKYFKELDKAEEWINNMEQKLYGLQRTVY